MSAAVTPTLFLGEPEEKVWLNDLVPVNTAKEAVAVICRGGSALLPEEDWDTARQVLRELGCTEQWIENRFDFAKTGRLRS